MKNEPSLQRSQGIPHAGIAKMDAMNSTGGPRSPSSPPAGLNTESIGPAPCRRSASRLQMVNYSPDLLHLRPGWNPIPGQTPLGFMIAGSIALGSFRSLDFSSCGSTPEEYSSRYMPGKEGFPKLPESQKSAIPVVLHGKQLNSGVCPARSGSCQEAIKLGDLSC
jgi:hypothetical protein